MKVAIIHESSHKIKILRDLLCSVPCIEVIWQACHREESIQKCSLERPELLLMDINIAPQTIQHIMKNTPCAVLLLTDDVDSNTSKIFEAMGFGALDVVHFPNESSQ